MPPWRIYVERARASALGITVGVAFTSGAIYVFSNSTYFGLRKFKRTRVLRNNANAPLQLSDNAESIIWQTMDAANVSGFQRGNLMFFPSRDASSLFNNVAEPVWRGSLYMRSGGAVGFPFYYNWERQEDVKLDVLAKAWGIDVAKLTPADVQEVKKYCVLSPDARRYAVARALALMYNNEVLYGILHFEFFLFTSLMTATYMWNAHARAIYNFAGLFANISLWRLVTLWYRRRVYRNAITAATSIAPEVANGADEYYEKTNRLNELIGRLRTTRIPNSVGKVWAYLFSIRPAGMSLEDERLLAQQIRSKLQSGELLYKPMCRGYVAAGKRMAMPPVPILPTSEAVSEPQKFLKRSGLEGDLEKELLSGPHFRHLQNKPGTAESGTRAPPPLANN